MWRDSPGSCAGKVEGVPCEGSRVVMVASWLLGWGGGDLGKFVVTCCVQRLQSS